MRPVQIARELVAYEGWANQRILAAAAELDLRVPQEGASFGSIEGTLGHILASQRVWLSRWNGETSVQAAPAGHPPLAAQFGEVQAALEGFVEALTESQYFAEIEFSDSRGNPHREVFAVMLAHLVNHGTYHRGEAAVHLTAAGHSPGDLDLVVYRRLMDPAR